MEQLENLGRYQLLRVLGRGAMGVVYEGIDPKLNRQVAVKTILKSQMLDPGLAAEYTARFMREAQAVARLNHPNIVQVFDFGNEAEVAYIVMEFIRGKELKSYIEEKRLFAIDETVSIVCELLDALEYAHAAGVIHRDIKPANVMLDAASRVKLTDFGVARLSDAGGQEGTRPGTMVGTPGYMSPEQIKGLTVGPQADLFAVGVLLYQCLTLQKPFTGNSDWDIYYKIVHDDPTPASQLRNGIPGHLDKVIQRALAKDPLDRYPSARSMADDLKLVVSNAVFDDEATRLVVDLPNRDRSSDQTLATSASIASGRAGTKFSPQTGTTDAERDFWSSIKDSGDIDELESYVAQFPDGLFAKLARIRINKLSGGTVVAESTGINTIPPAPSAGAAQEAARRQAEMARAEEERRQAEDAARRQAEEARRAAEAAQRRAAEEAEQRKAAEETARRRAAEEAAQRKAAEEAAKRKAAEAATARRLAEEAEEARRKAVEEAAKRQALEEESRRMEEARRRAAMAKPAPESDPDADSTVMFRRPAAPAPALDDVDAAASKLFASAPSARPAPPPAAPPVESAPKSKLPLIAGGVAAAVLALGALMFMGGDKNKDGTKLTQAPSAAPSAPAPASPLPAAAAPANTTQQADQQARAEEESRRKSQEDARLAEEAAQRQSADAARRAAQSAEAANKKAQNDARRAEEAAKKKDASQQRAEEDRKQKEAAKKKDAEDARKKAAESGPEGMLKKARETRKAGNLKEAIKLYTQAYNAGSGQAAKELGDYYHAAGPDQDADFAELWYGRARQKGIKIGK